MSDTPLTDAEVNSGETPSAFRHLVRADFARDLERELAEASAARGQLDGLLKRIGQLNAALDEANQRAESLEKQFGTCSVCGYVAWQERVVKSETIRVVKSETIEVCVYCELKQRSEKSEAACAELKALVKGMWEVNSYEWDLSQADIDKALAEECGKDFIRKDDPVIVELRDTLQEIQATIQFHEDYDRVETALTAANEKGLG